MAGQRAVLTGIKPEGFSLSTRQQWQPLTGGASSSSSGSSGGCGVVDQGGEFGVIGDMGGEKSGVVPALAVGGGGGALIVVVGIVHRCSCRSY